MQVISLSPETRTDPRFDNQCKVDGSSKGMRLFSCHNSRLFDWLVQYNVYNLIIRQYFNTYFRELVLILLESDSLHNPLYNFIQPFVHDSIHEHDFSIPLIFLEYI